MCLLGTGVALGVKRNHHRTLTDVAQRTVLNNPEVRARWHTFRKARKRLALPRRFPAAHRRHHQQNREAEPSRIPVSTSTTHSGCTVSLSQTLFDGLLTHKVKAHRPRPPGCAGIPQCLQNAALEAARLTIDVIRYRYMVRIWREQLHPSIASPVGS